MSLKIENVTVELQKEEILHGVSLDIREGEFVSLLGSSGCGKTTLLKSVAGLLEVQEGEIWIQGRQMTEVPPEKRGTVIVFQDLRLFPHMTVEKNLAFPMELRKVPRREQQETVRRLLAAVQLSGFENRKMREMSGGQMQRVALARALAANPRVLLLDEPFSGLDEKLRLEMGSLVKKLHEEWKITTVLVTHDKREALQMSDKIALMSEGRIVQYDTPERMFCHPVSRMAAEYFGKVNYVEGAVQNGRFAGRLLTVPAALADGEYEAMVRPSAVQLSKGGAFPVREIIFMGEMAEVKAEVPGGEILAQMMSSRLGEMGLQIGECVGIRIEEGGITWFRKGEEKAYGAENKIYRI